MAITKKIFLAVTQKKKKEINTYSIKKKKKKGVPIVAQHIKNLTSIRECVGLITGLTK